MKELTNRQAEVMHAIIDHWVEHGFPPTLRELTAELGVSSTKAMSDNLRLMRNKGALIVSKAQSRALTLAPEYMRYVVLGWARKLDMQLGGDAA